MGKTLYGFWMWCFLIIVSYGAENQDDFVAWLHNSNEAMTLHQGTDYCAMILQSSHTNLAHLYVAPDLNHYAVITRSTVAQTVTIHNFKGDMSLCAYSNNVKFENGFSPLGIMWAPDADKLYVLYGYSDIGGGAWFPYDAKTGKMIGDMKRLESMKKSAANDTEEPVPVWTLGGKEFEDERAAADAGYTILYNPWKVDRSPIEYSTSVLWSNGKKYKLLLEVESDRWLLRVITDGKLLDTLDPVVAPVYQGVFFVECDGHIVAYVVNSGPNKDGFGCLDLGVRKLLRVTNLGKNGLLILTTNKNAFYWQLLNPRKMTMSK